MMTKHELTIPKQSNQLDKNKEKPDDLQPFQHLDGGCPLTVDQKEITDCCKQYLGAPRPHPPHSTTKKAITGKEE